MKLNLFFNFFLLLIIFSGCKNDEIPIENSVEIPTIPSSMEIDIDNDGLDDFLVEYYHGTVLSNFSDERIVGYFTPIGENLVLHKQLSQNLFLRELNEIEENVNEPLFWNDSGWTEDILSINNNLDRQWPNQWRPHFEEEQESYFLGLKLIRNNEIKLGWVELDFNLDTGETILLDKGVL